jgi:hypothetical protein
VAHSDSFTSIETLPERLQSVPGLLFLHTSQICIRIKKNLFLFKSPETRISSALTCLEEFSHYYLIKALKIKINGKSFDVIVR